MHFHSALATFELQNSVVVEEIAWQIIPLGGGYLLHILSRIFHQTFLLSILQATRMFFYWVGTHLVDFAILHNRRRSFGKNRINRSKQLKQLRMNKCKV